LAAVVAAKPRPWRDKEEEDDLDEVRKWGRRWWKWVSLSTHAFYTSSYMQSSQNCKVVPLTCFTYSRHMAFGPPLDQLFLFSYSFQVLSKNKSHLPENN
jgi:hypothetical protein